MAEYEANIADLKFDDKNFNRHTSYGMSLIEKSLRENGAGRSILIDKDGNIIAGNGIVESAGQIGLDKVKVVETTGDEIIAVKRTDISLNSKKGRKMALADNSTAKADLEWDEENLKSEFDEEELKDWGVDLDWQEETEVTEDEAPEVNENEPAKSKLGEVYHLGNHRLMCGDSTDAGSVAILMDGEKADMVFTDPPYGINIDNSNGKILGDGDLSVFNNSLKTINDFAKEDAHLYIYFGVQFIKECIEELKKYFKQTNILVQHITHENKPSPKGYFKNNYEMCYFSNRKDKDFNYGLYDVSETTLEDKRYNGDGKLNAYKALTEIKATEHNLKAIHPTQKTINICAFYINISSNSDEIVLDLFGGSGSTLIACEQLGRKCYMMELDPKYCDVIRKRYWKLVTGSEEGWEDGTSKVAG